MELLKAKKAIVHGGRIWQKGDTFTVGDRQDSLGKVVEGSAKAEADRLVAEGYAEKASAAKAPAPPAPPPVTDAPPAPPPLAQDEEEVEVVEEVADVETGEKKKVTRKVRRKKQGR